MLFYDYEDCLCAYIRNRGFVCVDANSRRFDEPLPAHFGLTTCDEAAPYTNPYGDVLLVHHRLPSDMCYNTVLQKLVPEDWPNMFTVEDGERNPYTEMLHGDVNADLVQPVPDEPWAERKTLYRDVCLTYDEKGKRIYASSSDMKHLFDMKKDEFIHTYQVRCIDW